MSERLTTYSGGLGPVRGWEAPSNAAPQNYHQAETHTNSRELV
jgi:hypothetical protein